MAKNIGDSQVARLLDLVPYLVSNQGIALEKIAEDFNTSKSEILADLNTLWMCGLPGYTPLELIDLSFDTGFVSIRNADVLSVPRKLTSAEVGAIIIGLSIIKESISSESKHIPLIEELISKLSFNSQLKVPEIISTGIPTDLRNKIYSAMKNNQKILISYHSFSRDEITTREIVPLTFTREINNEYVHSFCITSHDFRDFRLDRILDVSNTESLDSTSIVSEEKNENEYEILIKVISNARKIAETFQVKEPRDIKLVDQFHAKVYNSEWIVRTICSLQSSAVVVEPSEIRNLIMSRAQKALNLYS
jgi:proteasome accessory factor C